MGDANAKRAEQGRYNQIKSAFQANPKYKQHYEKLKSDFANNQNYKDYYKALKEKGIIQTEEEFFILVSKFSYGLFQISPQTAALRGFRGNPEKLKDARTNIEIAIKELIAKGFKTSDNGIEGLMKAAEIINGGSLGATTKEDYKEGVETKWNLIIGRGLRIVCNSPCTIDMGMFIISKQERNELVDVIKKSAKVNKVNVRDIRGKTFFDFTTAKDLTEDERNKIYLAIEIYYSDNFFLDLYELHLRFKKVFSMSDAEAMKKIILSYFKKYASQQKYNSILEDVENVVDLNVRDIKFENGLSPEIYEKLVRRSLFEIEALKTASQNLKIGLVSDLSLDNVAVALELLNADAIDVEILNDLIEYQTLLAESLSKFSEGKDYAVVMAKLGILNRLPELSSYLEDVVFGREISSQIEAYLQDTNYNFVIKNKGRFSVNIGTRDEPGIDHVVRRHVYGHKKGEETSPVPFKYLEVDASWDSWYQSPSIFKNEIRRQVVLRLLRVINKRKKKNYLFKEKILCQEIKIKISKSNIGVNTIIQAYPLE